MCIQRNERAWTHLLIHRTAPKGILPYEFLFFVSLIFLVRFILKDKLLFYTTALLFGRPVPTSIWAGTQWRLSVPVDGLAWRNSRRSAIFEGAMITMISSFSRRKPFWNFYLEPCGPHRTPYSNLSAHFRTIVSTCKTPPSSSVYSAENLCVEKERTSEWKGDISKVLLPE